MLTTLLCAAALAAAGQPAQGAAKARACSPIKNPYPGTRYEGVNLTGIRATGVSCKVAHRVVRGAHRKALGLPLPISGVRHFTWHGWHVSGDLRPAHDRYVATRGAKRVRWRF